MKTYILKTIDEPSYWFYHMYDGDHMLTDAELDTVFGTAGSAHFVFDFDGTSANTNQFYIRNNADTQTKIAMSSVLDGGSGAIEEGIPFLGTWNANSSTFSSFVKLIGRTLSDEQLTFLMHEIKKKGDVVQTTGTSQTDVMSQNAATKLVYGDPSSLGHIVIGNGATYNTGQFSSHSITIGKNATDNSANGRSTTIGDSASSAYQGVALGDTATAGPSATAIGYEAEAIADCTAVGWGAKAKGSFAYSTAIGYNAIANNGYGVAVGANAGATGQRSIAIGGCNYGNNPAKATASRSIAFIEGTVSGSYSIGFGADVTQSGIMNIETNGNNGYSSTTYRLLSGVYDGQSAHDAATKGQLDALILANAGAPTTSTTGTVGQILEDTTNGKLYICTAIVPGTDPDPDTYTWAEVGTGGAAGMTILSYGTSTYAQALAAYQANQLVYCRASSDNDPGSGSQLRMAFLAYVNDPTTPTEFEFQYYRSVTAKSDATQGDETFVYKLDQSTGWSVTKRNNYTKIAAGTGLTSTYSSGTLTLNSDAPVITMTSTDPGEGAALAANNFIAVY